MHGKCEPRACQHTPSVCTLRRCTARLPTCVSRPLLTSSWLRVMPWLLAMVTHDSSAVRREMQAVEMRGAVLCVHSVKAGRQGRQAGRQAAAAGGSLSGAKKVTARLGLEKRAV